MPDGVGFQTKGDLARVILERAVESTVPFGWFAGDGVYGSDRSLWLSALAFPHVLAISATRSCGL